MYMSARADAHVVGHDVVVQICANLAGELQMPQIHSSNLAAGALKKMHRLTLDGGQRTAHSTDMASTWVGNVG